MTDLLIGIGVIVIWLVLQLVVFPRIGIPT